MEYPKMLFRAGGDQMIHGRPLQTVTVQDEEGEKIAGAEGFVRYDALDASPLDHDHDGKPGGVANSEPLSDEEKMELLDAMTDDELREFVEGRTGKKPHPNAKRETLLERARA